MPQAVAYARFSDRPGAAECESVQHQFKDIREWCAARGLIVRDEFSDEAKSGADRARPGLIAALAACKKGDLFLVRNWERLARDRTYAGMVLEDLARRGISARSITEQGDMEDTMESRLSRGILLEVAQYRREMISAQTKAAMARYKAEGRCMSKSPPYGKRAGQPKIIQLPNGNLVKKKMWIDHPGELAVAAMIVKEHDLGVTFGNLADQMNVDCTPFCRGKRWVPSIVHRIYWNFKNQYGEKPE